MSGTDKGFSKIARSHVEEACRALAEDANGAKGGGSYFVRFQGQDFPAKRVVRESFRVANQREIGVKEFSGGQFCAQILQRLGFEVVVH
jgi:hypothetical protein